MENMFPENLMLPVGPTAPAKHSLILLTHSIEYSSLQHPVLEYPSSIFFS